MRHVCLVTGAAGVLGRALCADLASQYDLVAAYHRSVPQIASQLAWPCELESGNGTESSAARTHCVQADLTDRADVRRLVEVALARFGRIDAIVHCAADTQFHGRLTELWESEDYASGQLQINAVAPFLLTSAVFQQLWKNEPAENARHNRSIVLVSSFASLYVYPDSRQCLYAASKAAANMLTLYAAQELAPYSVRANALCPNQLSDEARTSRAVQAVRELLSGSATGSVVEHR
jgi:NAD(P)-dependent dehydrogenase (short-subunit alcohol dehydrogenase family)